MKKEQAAERVPATACSFLCSTRFYQKQRYFEEKSP